MDIFPMNILNAYHRVHGLPAFVKEAGVVTTDSVEGLPQTAFADPLRKLPIHDKAATWCSYLAYHSGSVQDPTNSAGPKLEKAAAFWGIGDECREVVANLQEQADPPKDDDFAMVSEFEGQKVRRFPVAGPNNVKESAEELEKTAHRYPLPWRRTAAQKILKRAADLSVQLVNDHQLQQIAGVGMAKVSEIVSHIHHRAHLVKDAKIREKFNALAEEVQKVDKLDPELLSKMAEAIDVADRASGLYKFYGRIPRPEEFCHKHTLKEASERRAGIIPLTNGQGLNKQALAKMSAEQFILLGDDFVSAISGDDGKVDVEKAAEIIPTLPADDADRLVNSL